MWGRGLATSDGSDALYLFLYIEREFPGRGKRGRRKQGGVTCVTRDESPVGWAKEGDGWGDGSDDLAGLLGEWPHWEGFPGEGGLSTSNLPRCLGASGPGPPSGASQDHATTV